MRIGFVVNDVKSEEGKFTTSRLGQAAVNRGHEVWVMGVGDLAYDPDNKHSIPFNWGTTALIVRDDLVFFTAGYHRGGALLKQVPTGDGSVTMEEIYPLNTDLSNKHGGVVLVGDYLYGDTDASGIPFCAELMTGDVKWKERGSGRGSVAVTVADGHLYLRYQDGVMVLAEASPDRYKEISSFKIPGSGERPSWSHPVIIGGKLYLREQDRIFCYDVKAKS